MKGHHRIVPIVLVVICAPIAAFALFVIAANIFTQDEPPPDGAFLQLPDLSVDDAENAYVEMQQIEQSGSFPSSDDTSLADIYESESWDEASVTVITAVHAADIDLFRRAAAKPKYQDAFYAHPSAVRWDSNLPSKASYRQIAMVVALDAECRARSGDIDGGFSEALDIVRLGHRIESGQGNVIEYVIGNKIKEIGLSAIRRIALGSEVTATQVRSIAAALEPFRDSRAGAVTALKMESIGIWSIPESYDELWGLYNLSEADDGSVVRPGFFERLNNQVPPVLTADNSLSQFVAQAVWAPIVLSNLTHYYYLPNQTRHFAVDRARENIAMAEADCTTVDISQEPRTFVEHAGWGGFFDHNAMGKFVTDLGRVSLGGFATEHCDEAVSVSATQTALAVRAYTLDTGHAPLSLTDLVPAYLDEVPADTYTGEPMRYTAEKNIVYSLGPSRVDIGGSPVGNDWQYQDNPSFSVVQE